MSGESFGVLAVSGMSFGVLVVSGVSFCVLVVTRMRESSTVRAVSPMIITWESSAVRTMETDTAGWRELGSVGWTLRSSKDGYRSQGSEEDGEEGREMHAGYC